MDSIRVKEREEVEKKTTERRRKKILLIDGVNHMKIFQLIYESTDYLYIYICI